MTKRLDVIYTTLLAELLDRCLDAQFDADFDETGLFKKRTVKGRTYWYYRPSSSSPDAREKYVGPTEDDAITNRVESFRQIKGDYQARRKLVSTLVREAGLFQPDPRVGATVEALWKAGLFRLRACLIGTVAYQTYGNVLGYRLRGTAMQTGDIDVAQFHSVSIAVDDSVGSLIDVLRSSDPSFRPVPQLDQDAPTQRFVAEGGLRVDVLTPNTRSDDRADRPVTMPALGSGAQPLRFLDYVIHEPVRTVMLAGAGIPVLVPQPARFTVHKLIVAMRRPLGDVKADKDLAQANELARALLETGREADLKEAAGEAKGRGKRWRQSLAAAIERMRELKLADLPEALDPI